jgi:hypothetical protein
LLGAGNVKANIKNKTLCVAHTCNSSTQEAEAEGSQIQDQSGLHSECQARLDYIVRTCLKT